MRRTQISRRMSSRRRKSTDRMAETRPILEERSAGRCEICAKPFAMGDSWVFDMHHRLSRARGGGDQVSNLLAVCHDCHMTAHSRVARSTDNGWLLPSGADPSGTSLIYQHFPAFLTDTGEVLEIDPHEEDPDDYRDLLIDDELGVR